MLTKIMTAMLTVIVLGTTYASAQTPARVRTQNATAQNATTHNAKAQSGFQKVWFSLAEGHDNM